MQATRELGRLQPICQHVQLDCRKTDGRAADEGELRWCRKGDNCTAVAKAGRSSIQPCSARKGKGHLLLERNKPKELDDWKQLLAASPC